MHLANCIRPNIAFADKLLVGFRAKPTKRHWNDVKLRLRYLNGIEDLGLFYGVRGDSNIKGYMYACFLFDPHQRKFQHMLCFPRTRGNNLLEVNKVESCNHIFKPFKNYSFAWGFMLMCLLVNDWWLQQRLLRVFKHSSYSNGYLRRECNMHCSKNEGLHRIRPNQVHITKVFFSLIKY